MAHFIRIAFWIVTLCGCLQARSLLMEDSNISFMRKNVKCPSESTFYAPTNVEKKCITTALDCIKRELAGTVAVECTDPNEDIKQAVEFFDYMINEQGHAPTNSSDCACERWPQTSFSQFLDKVEYLLPIQNAIASG